MIPKVNITQKGARNTQNGVTAPHSYAALATHTPLIYNSFHEFPLYFFCKKNQMHTYLLIPFFMLSISHAIIKPFACCFLKFLHNVPWKSALTQSFLCTCTVLCAQTLPCLNQSALLGYFRSFHILQLQVMLDRISCACLFSHC